MAVRRIQHLSLDMVLAAPTMIRDGLTYWPVPKHVTGPGLAEWDQESRVLVRPTDADPWEIAGLYMDLGFAPPLLVVERLYPLDRAASLRDRWIVRGARRTARAVEQRARDQVRRVHTIKAALQSGDGLGQLHLPFTLDVGDKT